MVIGLVQGTLEKGRMGSRRRRRTQTNPISLCAPWLWRALALQMASRGWRRRKLVDLDLNIAASKQSANRSMS